MASAGRRLEDDEIMSYMLTGLDEDYESVVSAVAAPVEPITLGELYTQLIAHEQRLEMRSGGSNSSANSASRGSRWNNGNNSNRGRGILSRGGSGQNQKGGGCQQNRVPFQAGDFCQIRTKEGHAATDCFKRFNSSYTGKSQKSVSAATSSYGVDTNWYMDSGATDHITSELEQLTVRDRYREEIKCTPPMVQV